MKNSVFCVWILSCLLNGFFLWADEMPLDSRIYVAGHKGLVGSALVRKLQEKGYHHLITCSSEDLNLKNQEDVERFFLETRPEYVFMAAAKVGGIKANSDYPAEFIYDNLMITANMIEAAYRSGVKKLLFLGSSCIYPKECPQPIIESYLMQGPLEESNEPYAIAKIAGIKLCQAYNRQYGTKYISCMPTNLYGPNDHFDLNNSHVMPALIRKFCEAKEVGASEVHIWGDGTPRREFLHVDDLASACLLLMNVYEGDEIVNIGTGTDLSIFELAMTIKQVVGFEGNLVFDPCEKNGTKQKLLNIDKIRNLGWEPTILLKQGIEEVVGDYLKNSISLKGG